MISTRLLATSISLLTAGAAHACDLCGTDTFHHIGEARPGWFLGVSEQFTRMKTIQSDGHAIDNDARQKLDSSITQIALGYQFAERIGVQVNAPLIRRTFRRATDAGIESGDVGGIGDVALLVNVLALDLHRGDFVLHASLTGGLKFPTGDSDRLAEEAHHSDEHAAGDEPAESHEHGHERHAGEEHGEEAAHAEAEPEGTEPLPDAVHGHDLALGSGSIDGIVGASVRARLGRVFFLGEVQYTIRSEGDHDYRHANDFIWRAGPGITLIERESHALAVQFVCSGETKDEDKFRGKESDDTAITQVFLGGKISASWRDRLSGEVALEVPVHQDNSGVQIVPDYRLRAGLGWAF